MAEQIIQLAKNVLKRVVCLYRVSTVGQVEKDDIPKTEEHIRAVCTAMLTAEKRHSVSAKIDIFRLALTSVLFWHAPLNYGILKGAKP